MNWTKPEFIEISLSGEVTAYANQDSVIQPVSEELSAVGDALHVVE